MQQCVLAPSAGVVRHDRLVYLMLRRGIDNDAEAVAELYLRAPERRNPGDPDGGSHE
jgi:hypothetical protein